MGQLTSLTLNCPAKVNLALSVGTPNPDGLHPLASWMVAIDFTDSLTLEMIDSEPSQFDIAPVNEVTDTHPHTPSVNVDWPLEKDLAFRAHALMEKELARSMPIRLTLRKRIPTGAGLGGGSSNAAATLVGLNRLFSLGLDGPALINLGQRLGSDISFLIGAILGQSSALVTGLGEQLEPLPHDRPIDLLLIFPAGLACPTGQVYAAFDRLSHSDQPASPDIARVRHIAELACQSTMSADAPFNDLQLPAFSVQPQLKKVQTQLAQHLRTPVHVTGSGSTLFVIAPSDDACKTLAAQISQTAGLTAMATRTLSP